MSTIHLTTDTVEIRLSPAERLSSLHGDTMRAVEAGLHDALGLMN